MIENDVTALETRTAELLKLDGDCPIGVAIDTAYNAKTLITALNRLQDRVKESQKLLLSQAKALCEKHGLDGAVGQNARLTLSEQEYPTVDDWGLVYGYLQETGNFQILQQRAAATRIKELIEAGENIPGISITPTVEPMLRKLQ